MIPTDGRARGASLSQWGGGCALIAVLVVAFVLPLRYADTGLMPLDQSIVFDGGWRLLSGQRPYADFVTPIGIVPSVMQAAVFRVLGVTWSAYAAHAAAVNVAFAALAYALMRLVEAGPSCAMFVALGSAVLFYPPFGTPYPEQHSFFFSLAAIWAVVRGRSGDRLGTAALLAVPSLALLAVLSKHLPAVLLAAPAVVAAAVLGWRRMPRATTLGMALPVLAVAAYLCVPGVSVADAWEYGVVLPFSTGSSRFSASGPVGELALLWHNVDPPETTLWLTTAVLVVAAATLGRTWHLRDAPAWRMAGARLALALGLAFGTLGFIVLTNNSPANGLGLVPLVVGLAWVSASGAVALAAGSRRWWRPVRLLAAGSLAAAAASDLWIFDRTINAERRVHAGWDAGRPGWSPANPALASLQLGPDDRALEEALDYVSRRAGNFLVYGDETILYGATGHPSVFPALFMHPGLTIPPEGTAVFDRFEQRILDRLQRDDVRFVLQRIDGPYMGPPIWTFRRLEARLQGCAYLELRWWAVRDVCRP